VLGLVTDHGYSVGLLAVITQYHQSHTGHCWYIMNMQGQLSVKLTEPVRIDFVNVYNVTVAQARQSRSTYAPGPRHSELWVLVR
jgi:hypothetical protein